MMTVNDISKLTGVSKRTLQYYDKIDLLKPIKYTDSGYRLYDITSLEKLQQILLFKELEFSLMEIKQIIDAPNFDKDKALEQQIELLTMKKKRLENLIKFAEKLRLLGGTDMDFTVFDTKTIDEYSKRAKAQWGETTEYSEFSKKYDPLPIKEKQLIGIDFMEIFVEFGKLKHLDPSDKQVYMQVKKLKDYISEHYYTCSNEILSYLGEMYVIDGEFTTNIDKAGGNGTTKFVSESIKLFCSQSTTT